MFGKRKLSITVSASVFILAGAVATAVGCKASATPIKNELQSDWRYIQSVQIKKISETQLPYQTTSMGYNYSCTTSPNGMSPDENAQAANPFSLVNISQIINFGAKVWQFINDNTPVVSAQTMSANALPKGTVCWYDLENWQPPRSDTYEIDYKNLFGINVVRLAFSLIYSYGGQYNGRGRYLMNATVQYRDLQVAWGGFHVNANVDVPTVTNIGTKQNPVAGLQLNIHWVVKGLNRIERTASFFIAGDGRPTKEL